MKYNNYYLIHDILIEQSSSKDKEEQPSKRSKFAVIALIVIIFLLRKKIAKKIDSLNILQKKKLSENIKGMNQDKIDEIDQKINRTQRQISKWNRDLEILINKNINLKTKKKIESKYHYLKER